MFKLFVVSAALAFSAAAFANQSMVVPGAIEVANVYRVPIRIVPASQAPGLPAPAVFYGNQLIAA